MQGKIMADHCAILVFRVARRRERSVLIFQPFVDWWENSAVYRSSATKQNKTKHYYTTIVATFGFCLEFSMWCFRVGREEKRLIVAVSDSVTRSVER